jgi:hypothetical protein
MMRRRRGSLPIWWLIIALVLGIIGSLPLPHDPSPEQQPEPEYSRVDWWCEHDFD